MKKIPFFACFGVCINIPYIFQLMIQQARRNRPALIYDYQVFTALKPYSSKKTPPKGNLK